jgi:hypothetical protein
MPLPLPAELVDAATPPPAKVPRTKRKSRRRKTVNAVLLLVVGGIVSLIVSLISGHVQMSDGNQQSQSSHQFQQWQRLQADALNEATLTREIYAFAQQCVGLKKMSWRECATLDPNYNTWASSADVMDTTGENIGDQEARKLAYRLTSLSDHVVVARSSTAAGVAEDKLWSAYEVLVGRLGVLIRTH